MNERGDQFFPTTREKSCVIVHVCTKNELLCVIM